jgi:hypothetical protein
VLLRGFLLLCIFWAMVSSAIAGTMYRCVGADDVPQFTERKVPEAKCKAISDSKYSGPAITKPTTTALKSADQVIASQAVVENASSQAPVVKTSQDGTRTSRGVIYKKQVDGINVYTNVSSKGAGNLHSRYVVIEKCYACGLTNTVNFGTVRLNLKSFAAEIKAASAQYGVDEAIVRAIIHAESAFRPHVVSPKNAQGLMQLIPGTAKRFGVRDAFDPAQNIKGGVQYLAFLQKRYKNNLTLVAAAYNAGEGAVDKYDGVPPYKETKNYVVRVGQLAERYRKEL